MIYHGIDIIEVARVRQAVERWGLRFLERVYTPGELADCGGDTANWRFESLAARWAAKEAAAKALGVGLSGLGASDGLPTMQEFEVRREAGGRPSLLLHGRAADAAAALSISELSLSLSHSRVYAVASVVGLGV